MWELDFDDAEGVVENTGMSFSEVVDLLLNGNLTDVLRRFGENIIESLFSDSIIEKQMFTKIIALGIMSAVLAGFARAFSDRGVSKTGDYIIQMGLVAALGSGVGMAISAAKEVVEQIVAFMQALLPNYIIAVGAANGAGTAMGVYEVIFLAIAVVQKIILNIVFPMICIYIIVIFLNYITGEDMFVGIASLLEDIIGWANKSLFAFIAGLNIVKNLICPVFDEIRLNSLGKLIGMIPGAGAVAGTARGMVIGSAWLLKNSIGVAAMLFLLFICIFPLVKLFVFAYSCKAAAAILQPIAKKEYVGCIDKTAGGLMLVLGSMSVCVGFFLLTIAMVCISVVPKM